jgi:hypothetical protein
MASLIANHSDEQIGDAGRAHLAERGELLTIDSVVQQDAAIEHLTLVDRPERACSGDLFGTYHYFQVVRLHLFHAAIEYDAAAIKEHDIGEDVLDLFHLVCRQ